MNDETRLEQLRWAFHGVKAPFSTAGTFVPDKPLTLLFRDKSGFKGVSAIDQIRTVDKQRLVKRLSKVSSRTAAILKAIAEMFAE